MIENAMRYARQREEIDRAQKEKCEECKGTGKVGTAISTEGPTDIFCLECAGTGNKRKKK